MPHSLSSIYGGRGIALSHGKGSRVYDTEGREYIDFFNGHGAALFGHSNPKLLAALENASRGIWSSGAGFESPVREKLAEELTSLFGEGSVFLCNSGTEAIEAALKLSVALRPKRRRILACRRAFHGRTCGALSMTFNPKYRMPFSSLITNIEHYSIEDIAEHIDSDTAVVFIEPVQGEGGVHQVGIETGRSISESCKKNGVILAADEVQTGLGRCGAPFASPLAGLDPDIICLAKGLAGGLPAGAVIWKKELGDFPAHSHGSTYGGNEFISHISLAALNLLKENNLSERAEKLGIYFRSELAKIDNKIVKEIRGLGLLNGVELEISSQDAVKELQKNGVLSLAAGPRVVRFLPSFAATEEDMAQVAQVFGKILGVLSK